VQRQVIEAARGKRLLQLDADLIQRQHRIGDQERCQRCQPFFLEFVQQGEGQRRQVDQDEAANGDRVQGRQRRVADALAAAEMVEESATLALGLQEGEAIHAVALAGLAQQLVEVQGHVGGHVFGRPYARRLLLAQQRRQFRHFALAAQPGPRRLSERGRPADNLLPPVFVGRPMSQGRQRQVARLIDDAAPQFPRFPPTVVTRVGAHDEKKAQQGAGDFVGAYLNGQIEGPQRSEPIDECGEEAEGESRRQHAPAGRAAPAERLAPKTRLLRPQFRHRRTS